MMKLPQILLLTAMGGWAQPGPVSVDFPSTYVRYNDNTNGAFFFGDTWHFTAYTAAGNRFGTYNDGWMTNFTNFANLGIVKLGPYDVNSANGTGIQIWSHPSFQAAYLQEIKTGLCAVSANGCSPKSYDPFCIAGHCYINVFAQSGDGWAYHSTLIRSDDLDSAPPHFCNSATLVDGQCPKNDTTLKGSPPDFAGGTTGIMFPGNANGNNLGRLMPVLPANWQDDGSTCPVIPESVGGNGTGDYVYFFTEGGNFMNMYGPYRVLCTDLPKLDANKWQAWDGSAWTSTLANAAVAAKLSFAYPPFNPWGTRNAAGTSPAITYLPDLNVFVMLGQICFDCETGYRPDLLLSQTSTLTDTWTVDPLGKRWSGVYQYGTNPRTNKLSGALTTAGPGESQTINVTVNYDPGLEPPLPFTIQVESEQLQVTAANAKAWTVTRGYNGTTPAAHADATQLTVPYRLRPGLVAFVPGTYSYANQVVKVDLVFEGEAMADSGTTPNNAMTKANNVYGAYFATLTFRRSQPQTASALLGNLPLSFSSGPVTAGTAANRAVPRRGLVAAWDFYQNAGGTLNGIKTFWPQDLISGQYCAAAQNAGYCGYIGWNKQGMEVTCNNVEQVHRCETPNNFPISGDSGFTELIVFQSYAVTGTQAILNHGLFGSGQAFIMYTGANGNGSISGEWSFGGARSAAGVISPNTWYVFAVTKAPGPINSTANLYLNGAPLPIAAAASFTPNIAPAPIRYGLNGNSSSPGCPGATCNYQDFWNGTLAGHFAWSRVLSPAEIRQTCVALKSSYVRRGISLTCE
jgi:hypothetical protein